VRRFIARIFDAAISMIIEGGNLANYSAYQQGSDRDYFIVIFNTVTSFDDSFVFFLLDALQHRLFH